MASQKRAADAAAAPAAKHLKSSSSDVAAVSAWQLAASVATDWKGSILETLKEYISIPNQSPLYDPEWETNGHLNNAVKLLAGWVSQQSVKGLEMQVLEEKGRTPLIFIEVAGQAAAAQETVLLYGHLDKQPPMTEFWDAGLGPWKPVIKDGKLYGRGGADDGYAVFCAISAIKALQAQGLPHARCVVVIEASEESGSRDLPFWIDRLKAKIGTPSLIVCLDSGCGNYEQLWVTTSLRGVAVGTLTVDVLKEGVHSGKSSGVVVETTRIMRQLLDRIEDSKTGVMHDALQVNIPPEHLSYATAAASVLGDLVYKEFPFLPNVQPALSDLKELLLNKTWRPTLCLTGVAGMPTLVAAGNVMRPSTSFKLSIRLPPSLHPKEPMEQVKGILTANPPYGSVVKFDVEKAGAGWMMPKLSGWLENAFSRSSKLFYEKPACFLGEGGSIPFMGMLAAKFPEAQFAVLGVLGPNSNAHGPNEFLHLDFAEKLTCCVSTILADHAHAHSK